MCVFLVFENYMIEELVQQFEKLRDAVRSFSPKTKVVLKCFTIT